MPQGSHTAIIGGEEHESVDMFPRTNKAAYIKMGVSSHVETVVLLVRYMSTYDEIFDDDNP